MLDVPLLAISVLLLGAAAAAYAVHHLRLRRLARQRLEGPALLAAPAQPVLASRGPPPLRRWPWVPWLLALGLGFVLYSLVRLPPIYALTLALIFGLLGTQFESFLAEQKLQLLETQLADAIDLMVSALQAGASVPAALEIALTEARPPLRPQLQEVVGRIRFGDEPRDVFQALGRRLPLESFRLFAATLGVHAEVGGSLARTLASVGRIIRDRLEIGRKVRSMTTQARVSIWAVLGVTYFIALVIWRNNPERMTQFLTTSIGQTFVAAAMLLQALGIVWAARLSRLKY